MKYFFTALLLLSAGCAHTPSTQALTPNVPPTFGFAGRVRPHRKVVCIIDKDMTQERCEAVSFAVEKINSAVGFELLKPPSLGTIEQWEMSETTDEITFVGVDNLLEQTEGQALGITKWLAYEAATGYLRRELVILDPAIFAGQELMESVMLHEMLHSVGASHAEQEGAFTSVLRPTWRPGAPASLSPGDVATLRLAYPTP